MLTHHFEFPWTQESPHVEECNLGHKDPLTNYDKISEVPLLAGATTQASVHAQKVAEDQAQGPAMEERQIPCEGPKLDSCA